MSGIGDFAEVKEEGEQWKIFVVAKVAVEGLTMLCQNFWGRVEGMRDFWYNKNVDWAKYKMGN